MQEFELDSIKNDFQGFIGYSDEAFSLLIRHIHLVEQANKITNITRIIDTESAIYLHAYDSLLGLRAIDEAIPGEFIDIGSGAGFPGIPLALFCERGATLIDSIKKKATILQNFVDELGLSNRVAVKAVRSEQEAREKPNHYAAVSVRAVSSLASIMELASPLLKENGVLVAYKGPDVISELAEAKQAQSTLGMEVVEVEHHKISKFDSQRFIVIVKKVSDPMILLPRGEGKAQRKPLKQ
jgi:16S rRNA (guanine527-N7)-methyltransferase